MNVAKTFAVLFSIRPVGDPDDPLLVDGEDVQFEQSSKFLRMVIDNQLYFKDHILHIWNKIYIIIGVFCKLKYILRTNILANILFICLPLLIILLLFWVALVLLL